MCKADRPRRNPRTTFQQIYPAIVVTPRAVASRHRRSLIPRRKVSSQVNAQLVTTVLMQNGMRSANRRIIYPPLFLAMFAMPRAAALPLPRSRIPARKA